MEIRKKKEAVAAEAKIAENLEKLHKVIQQRIYLQSTASSLFLIH